MTEQNRHEASSYECVNDFGKQLVASAPAAEPARISRRTKFIAGALALVSVGAMGGVAAATIVSDDAPLAPGVESTFVGYDGACPGSQDIVATATADGENTSVRCEGGADPDLSSQQAARLDADLQETGEFGRPVSEAGPE